MGIVKTPTQPQLNSTSTLVGLDTKMTLHTPTQTQCQLLQAQFGSNFKSRFVGTSRTDSNYHGDICPGNICLGDICPILTKL